MPSANVANETKELNETCPNEAVSPAGSLAGGSPRTTSVMIVSDEVC